MIKLMVKKQARGFTLVELLVVIAIISILTVITVSQFNTARMRSRDVQRKGDLNGVYKALLLYYADFGVFPDESEINTLWGVSDFSGSDGYLYFKGMPKEKGFDMGRPQYCYKVKVDNPGDPVKKMALYAALENQGDEEYEKYAGGGENYSCGGSGYNYVIYSPNAGPGDFN